MKQTIIKLFIILSLFFSSTSASLVHAQAVNNLLVTGSVTVLPSPVVDYSGVTGTYIYGGTYNSHNYWSHTDGGVTYYIYYNTFNSYNDWEIFTALTPTNEDFLFFGSNTADPTLCPTWTLHGTYFSAASIYVNEDTPTPVPEINITGGGFSIFDGDVNPNFQYETRFVSTNISSVTNTRTYTIVNSGTGTLTISGATVSGTDFTISTPPALTVAPTVSTTFTVTFDPTTVGTKTATVTITNNDSNEGSYDFSIDGYAYSPQNLVVTGISTPSAANTAYIHQGILNNYEYWLSSNGYYLYMGDGNWNIDNNLDPSITDKVEFYSTGVFNPSILDATGWTGSSGSGARGTGAPVIAPATATANINVKGNSQIIGINDNTPSFLDNTKFGSVDISSGSRSRTYTIENTGGAPLTITGITFGGSDPLDFSVTTPPSSPVAAFGSTTFAVTFNPTTAGDKTAIVNIASNDSDENPYPFYISGYAFSPKNLLVSGITGTYSDANGTYIPQGILNEFQYWKHATLNYYIYEKLNETTYYWNIDTDTNDASQLFFSVGNGENGSPVNVPSWGAISGEGTPVVVYAGPEMDVKGNSISIPDGSTTPNSTNDTDFGSGGVGADTLSRTFTIENTGYEDLDLNGSSIVDISGTDASDFSVFLLPESPVSALGGTTTFTIDFTPSASGTRSATVSIANNDSDENPYTFNIQGTGLTTPSLTTAATAVVGTTTATLGGDISDDGGAAVTERGVVYSTTDTTPMIGGLDVIQNANGSGSGTFSEVITGLSLATHYYYQAYAMNGQGTSYGGVQEFTTLNEVSSITRPVTVPELTNDSSLTWDVVFGAPVTGLSAANFMLDNSGLTSPTITDVSGSGSSWTVTADSGTGSGTLWLSLTSSVGLNAELNNLTYNGQSYIIDRTAPTTISFTREYPTGNLTNEDMLTFQVTFDESVSGVADDDFDVTGITGEVISVDFISDGVYAITVSDGGLESYNGVVGLDFSSGMTITDAAGNDLANSEPATDETYTLDNIEPATNIEQAAGQSDPTNAGTINFTVTFDESVTDFSAFDVNLSGSAGATNVMVSGSGTTYNVAVSGMTGDGSVIADVGAGSAMDAAGNTNTASTSTDNEVTYDNTDPAAPVLVTPANGSTTNDNTPEISGTAEANSTVTVWMDGSSLGTSSADTSGDWTFSLVSALSNGPHAVVAVAEDAAGNNSADSATNTFTVDNVNPGVTIEQASGQSDPTGSSPINFTVTFDEVVTGFAADDVSLSGSAGATTALVSGSGTTYNVAVSGMAGDGSVFAVVEAGGAVDAAGNTNDASTSTDNQVDYDTLRPSVVVSSTTTSPTHTSPISVTITFDESVSGFTPSTASGDMVITNGADSNPAGSDTTYTFDLTPAGQGPVTVTIPASSAQDGAGNLNTVSNTFSITFDSVSPTVTIEQASAQADPTNAGTINFTVTFSEPVTDFATGDVTLGGTAGATTATVSGSGASYNVAVSGMTTNGTVSATLAAGVAQDAALNLSAASTSIDNVVTYILGPLDVSINQAAGQNDPTNALPVNFTVVFGRAINLASFTPTDITLGGTAPGTPAVTISEIAPNNGTTFTVAVNGLSGTGTVTAAIAANSVQDPASNNNTASTTTDNSVMYDPGVPTISGTNLAPTLAPSLTSILIRFSEAVYDNPLSDTETDDVTNPANYFLFEKGANGVSERTACNVTPPVTSDDVYISIDQVIYDSAAFTSTLSINGGVALPVGQYELFVCGTTSILDLAGNAINNGLSDYTYDFRVIQPSSGAGSSSSSLIPLTGFAPNRMTSLPMQPAWKTYSDSTLWLEIPALGLQQSIVGVPEADGWDVTWLGDQIGYLGGTAFPTWAGNSVLTGHATNANGGKGPFAALGTLRWGDQIVIHAFGQEYVYEVRTVNRLINPKDTSVLKKHEDLPWVTLITCNGYDEKTGTYRWRTAVRAVQISVVDEK